MRDTKITDTVIGVLVAGANSSVFLDRTTITGCTAAGVQVQGGTATISRSMITQNSGYGVWAETGTEVNIAQSMVNGNGHGIALTGNTTVVRMVDSALYNNLTPMVCNGTTLAVFENDRVDTTPPVSCVAT